MLGGVASAQSGPEHEYYPGTSDPVSPRGSLGAAFFGGKPQQEARLRDAPPLVSFYARVNSFGVFAGYSNDSTHILAGSASERKLLVLGASYSRRLILARWLNWQYDAEILPLALDSDPVAITTVTETFANPPQTLTNASRSPTEYACHPTSVTETYPDETYSAVVTCSRRWVMGGGISPVGFRWNFLPRHAVQPFVVGHGGFIESVNAIPIPDAGNFNFTYDGGAGFEWYRARMRSVRVEARFHHISNKETAPRNPGIDCILFQASYVFGR
jgi:hypothetical protein